MTIHNEHPFLPPEQDRNPLRRLRGRLASPVTVLTAGGPDDRAGLTVSSVLILDGEPGLVLAVIDPLSDLYDALTRSGRAVLNLLGRRHQQLSDAFAFVAPAPGGLFRLGTWDETAWGPALSDAPAWAGCRRTEQPIRPAGWGVLVELAVEHTQIGPEDEPLVHHRGRYRELG